MKWWTCAFMLAPSIYTWPPLSWIILHISSIPSSYTPWVEGYVTCDLYHGQTTDNIAKYSNFTFLHLIDWKLSLTQDYVYHKSCKVVPVILSCLPQLFNIDISLGISSNSDNFHSTHCSTGRICPMGWNRNDAHIAVMVPSWLQWSFGG